MSPDRLSSTFTALADPTRRAILARLALGEGPVIALAEPFALSLSAVSKHVRVLERADLDHARACCAEAPVPAAGDALRDSAEWLEHYRAFWDGSFDRLDHLRDLQARGGGR